ncbi:hypothetical protein NM208_g2249 [Fusarium decemcellulare]|uniref:Uncharacterized protein n=1 Tax=Fusarium decemcellulare TaxID=57161 RepID=A0ACC1STA2_9HYPO|nr:hypothetical protein NM208_g2249 [Fusarium decemcellulare]
MPLIKRSGRQRPRARAERDLYGNPPDDAGRRGVRSRVEGGSRNRRIQESGIEDPNDSEYEYSASLPSEQEPEPDQDREDEAGDVDSKYRPIMQISWRSEICRLLEISPDVSDDKVFEAMGTASKKLKEIDQLRSRAKARQGPPRFQIIHSVRCESSRSEDKLYIDPPWVVETGPNNAHLRGSQPIWNFELYLERNKEIVFIVYKDYRCCGRSRPRARSEADIEVDDASSLLEREQISVISPVLRSALVHLAGTALKGIPHPDFGENKDINHPYIWWFHRRSEIDKAMDKPRPEAWLHVTQLFHDYILDRMMDDWETVDKLLERSKISAQYMDYLFVPDHIVISKRQVNALEKLQGFVAKDWLTVGTSKNGFSASIDVSSWSFDGKFLRASEKLSINSLPSESDEFDITELPLYPMEFASESVVTALRNRGQMFWKCRFRNYVSCATEQEDDGIQNSAS